MVHKPVISCVSDTVGAKWPDDPLTFSKLVTVDNPSQVPAVAIWGPEGTSLAGPGGVGSCDARAVRGWKLYGPDSQMKGALGMKPTIIVLVGLLHVGSLAAPSQAQENTPKLEWASLSAIEVEPWRFSGNVHGWLPDAPIDIQVGGLAVSLPEDFSTILQALNMAAMFEAEVHKGPLGVFASAVYYRGKIVERFPGLLGVARTLTLKEEAWLVKYGASYDVGRLRLGSGSDSPTVTFQPYFGALYLHDDIRLDLSPGIFGVGGSVTTTIEFNTPIIGANTLWALTDRWSLRLGGNYGGFGVDNVDDTYELAGTVHYHFDMWAVSANAFAGYRYLHLDYDKSSDKLHLDIKGPVIGLGFEF